nr:MAG TPA: Protein of unknown function (DUF1363) [Caudoviricetes sp.]
MLSMLPPFLCLPNPTKVPPGGVCRISGNSPARRVECGGNIFY